MKIPHRSFRYDVAVFCASILTTVSAWAYPTVEEVKASNGLTAWLMHDDTLPVFSMRILFHGGGSAYDPEKQSGLSALVSGAISEGSGGLDAAAYDRALESRAIELSFGNDSDFFSVGLRSLEENKTDAFALLAQALISPHMESESVARIKREMQTGRTRQQESPGDVAALALSEELFPGHAYSRNALGTEASVAAITPEELKNFVRERLTRERMVIAVAGDLTAEELKTLLETYFADLPQTGAAYTKLPWVEPVWSKTTRKEVASGQSVALFALPAVKRTDPEFYAVYVLNHILGGGGFASRLMQRLREEQGLVYGAGTQLSGLEEAALIEGSLSTRPDQEAKALELLREELSSLQKGGITDAMVKAAKSDIIGGMPLNLDTTGKMTSYLVGMQLHELGRDYLEKRNAYFDAVTPDDVRKVAAKYLDVEKLTLSIAGPKPKAEAAESKAP